MDAQNNEDVERHWAMKAFQHAETYFRMLTTIPGHKMKLTKLDDKLYEEFRKEFRDLNIENINEDDIKSPEAKEKWRLFIAQFEDKVEDFNFGTLLRNNCKEDYGPENSFFVPRIQFLCIEVARNKEGLNDSIFQNEKLLKEHEYVDNAELEQEMAALQKNIESQLQ